MSWEAKYNLTDPAVPGIVTGWNEVDVPTNNLNTLNNPITFAVGGVVTPGACVADVVNHAILPLTDAQATRLRLFQGAASQPAPFEIKTFVYQGIIGKLPTTILTGIRRVNIRFFSLGASNVTDFTLGLSQVFDGVTITLSSSGVLTAKRNGLSDKEIYLDIIYS